MNKTIWWVAGGAIAVIIIAMLLFTFTHMQSNNKGNNFLTQRANLIKIIERYYQKEEYDRALDKIEELLALNIDDEEAFALQDLIIDAKKQKALERDTEKRIEEQRDRERLYSTMSNAIEKQSDKPLIIKKSPQSEELEQELTDTTQNIAKKNIPTNVDPKELERRKKIQSLINDGIDDYNSQSYAKAKDKLLKALQLEQDNPEANAILAATLFDENSDDPKNIEEAVNRAQRALKKDPDSETARLTLAKIYSKRGMKDQAIEEYNKVVKLNPNNYSAFYELGKLYFINKDFPRAQNSFNSAVNIKKDFINGYFYLGLTQYRLNKKPQAINSYKTAISLDPNFYEAYVNLGEIYRLANDPSNALVYFKKANTLQNRFTIQKKIGEIQETLKQYDEAYDSYTLSISLNPQSTQQEIKSVLESYVSAANIKNMQGKFKDALQIIKKGLDIDPQNPSLNFMGGFASDKLGNSEEAKTFYQTTLQNHPDYIEAYINLSTIYIHEENTEEALKLLITASTKNNENFAIYNNLGSAYQKLSRYNEAITNYKKAISLNSQEATIYYNIGLCYKAVDSLDNSIIVLKKALELNKDYYECYYEIGESYFLKQEYENAKQYLQTIANKQPQFAQIDKVHSMLAVANQ